LKFDKRILAVFLLLMKPAIAASSPETVLSKLKDSKYFRETFFSIVNRDEQTVPFKQNAAQTKYYVEKTDDDLILKARHLGFSSEIEGDFLFDCMFTPNTNAVTMAHTLDDTHVHMQRIKFYKNSLKNSDNPIEVTVEAENRTELYLPHTNSYYWIGTAGAKGWGRGRQVTRFHGSEVAHWKDQGVLTAVLNARSKRAKTRLETTANGMEKFAELWFDAEDPAVDSPWKQHFFAWWMDPDNIRPVQGKFAVTSDEGKIREIVLKIYKVGLSDEQLNWWRWERSRQADKFLMPQEHPSFPREAFLSSGRHVLPLAKIEIMESRIKDPVMVGYLEDDEKEIRPVDNPEGPLTIWIPPREGKRYFMPADLAEGVKDGAFNVAPVMDRASWEVVAQIRLRCDPGDFGRMMATLGEYYNWALLGPEMNNHGHAALEAIKAWRGRGYPHILKTTDLWQGVTEKLGFPTDDRTKALTITALRNAIDQLAYVENSPVALKEMMGAVYNEHGKMVSERSKNAVGKDKERLYLDCVITRMIGIYCLKFLTLDSTYRTSTEDAGGILISRVAGPKTDKKTKPWMRRSA